MLKTKRIFYIITGLVLSAFVLASPVSAIAYGKTQERCQRESVPVKLSPEGNTYSLVGWLCAKGSPAGKPLQLLLPGLTYDHHYWDFPYKESKYSYVKHATSAGFATFAVDRIGTGESSHPPAAEVTFPAQAYATLQLVDALKNGDVGGHKFKRIIGVGHSMGAGIWMLSAELRPKAVDGLILLDYMHQANLAAQADIIAARHPAKDDPKFASANLPEGYITTKPRYRHLYYNPEFADPRVIKQDEKLKQTTTTGEVTTLLEARNPKYSLQIKVPVLLVVGQKDSLFCNEAEPGLSCKDAATVKARESQFYSPEAELEVAVVPKAGHDTNLHYNAPMLYHKANTWARSLLY